MRTIATTTFCHVILVCLLLGLAQDGFSQDFNLRNTIKRYEKYLGPGKDKVADRLELTVANKSLPVWTELDKTDSYKLGRVTRSLQKGILLIGTVDGGHGTGFVISKKHRLVATNAHVADILHKQGELFVIANGSRSLYSVEKVWYHPGVLRKLDNPGARLIRSMNPFAGDVQPSCPDVAVLQLEDDGTELPREFLLANEKDLKQLFASPVAMIGFPGHDTSQWPKLGQKPAASYLAGVVSRISDFQLNGDVANHQLQFVQHTMSSWGGFSGSPIVLTNGRVAAIHNSVRYVSHGKHVKSIPHGIRIDCLWELLVHHQLDSKVPLGIDKSKVDVERWLKETENDKRYRRSIKLLEEANALYGLKKWDEMIEKSEEVIRLTPNYASAYQLLATGYSGKWYFQYGQYGGGGADLVEQSIKYQKKAIKLAPSDPWLLNLLAQDYNNLACANGNGMVYRKQAIELAMQLLQTKGIEKRIIGGCFMTLGLGMAGIAIDTDNKDKRREIEAKALEALNEAIRCLPKEPAFYYARAGFWRCNKSDYDRESKDKKKAEELMKELAKKRKAGISKRR